MGGGQQTEKVLYQPHISKQSTFPTGTNYMGTISIATTLAINNILYYVVGRLYS
jgi:hypothetical protein